ncbi:MAG TPA: hypothetical protein DDW18_00550 [Firmicutes bacterium]|mgnify:FL=1|nr:hypothetical protein [Bacillota bacterium]
MKKFYSREKVLEIRKDIMKAAEHLYKKNGYEYVNLLRISGLTHLSRPSIYNYYHSKEEIFLDILLREYNSLGSDIKKTIGKKKIGQEEIANQLSEVVLKHLYLLKLISSYENAIEENSSLERLKEYRQEWEKGYYNDFIEALNVQFPETNEQEKDYFINLFTTALYGIYPMICPSEERIASMKERGTYKEMDRHKFVSKAIKLLLSNID